MIKAGHLKRYIRELDHGVGSGQAVDDEYIKYSLQ